MATRVLTVAAVGVLVLVAASTVVVPRLAGATALTVLTPSMEPGLPPGTLVVVRPVEPADVRIGDVLTYQPAPGSPELVTHRVTAVVTTSTSPGRRFELQGDSNAVPDRDLVAPEQVRGRLWYAVPVVGRLTSAVHGDVHPGLVLAAAAGLLGWSAYLLLTAALSAVRQAGSRADGGTADERGAHGPRPAADNSRRGG